MQDSMFIRARSARLRAFPSAHFAPSLRSVTLLALPLVRRQSGGTLVLSLSRRRRRSWSRLRSQADRINSVVDEFVCEARNPRIRIRINVALFNTCLMDIHCINNNHTEDGCTHPLPPHFCPHLSLDLKIVLSLLVVFVDGSTR